MQTEAKYIARQLAAAQLASTILLRMKPRATVAEAAEEAASVYRTMLAEVGKIMPGEAQSNPQPKK